MSYSRDDGTSTPNLAGLIQCASGFRVNDGTFELHFSDVFDSPTARPSVSPLSNDHGGFAGTPFYEARSFVIEGRMWVPTLADIWAGKDDLEGQFSLETGLQVLTLNTSGWSATRQVTARVDGAGVQFIEPPELEKLVPQRDFTIQMIAPDPRRYATTQQTVTVASGGTTLTNNGKASTPVTAWFDGTSGALTAPLRLTAPDGSYIEYNANIASGHWVKVNTRDGTAGTTTAVDDTGASVYANVTKASASLVTPGGHTWTSAKAGGSGVIKALFSDAW